MAPAATTTDAICAIGEPRRRQILDLLATGEQPVSELVRRLDVAQPVVSKHLAVLRAVGLVHVREEGRQRFYRLDTAPLRPLRDWLATYDQLWSDRFDLLDNVLTTLDPE